MQNKQADHKNELKSNLPHPVTCTYPKTNLANSIVTFIPTNITYAKINCGQFKCKTKMRMFSYKNTCLLVTFHNMSYKPWEAQHCTYNDSRALKKISHLKFTAIYKSSKLFMEAIKLTCCTLRVCN